MPAPRIRKRRLLVAAAAFLCSCSKPPDYSVSPKTSNDKSGPSAAQMQQDLMGRDVLYFIDGKARHTADGITAGIWTVGEGELKDFTVVRRFPNIQRSYGERTDEVHALVTLEGTDQRIRGVLVFQYIRLDPIWKLLLMGPRDGDEHHDFSFERVRIKDGTVLTRMTPQNAPTGPWRFAPTTYSTPIPALRVR